jgi:hypothetical protein
MCEKTMAPKRIAKMIVIQEPQGLKAPHHKTSTVEYAANSVRRGLQTPLLFIVSAPTECLP